MNGDGFADLAVGAPDVEIDSASPGDVLLEGSGRAYVYSGHDNWTTLLRTLEPTPSSGMAFGYALSSIHDRRGSASAVPDGKADLVIGGPGLFGTGAALWYGNVSDVDPLTVEGEDNEDRFGAAVLLVKDVTGDQLPDLMVGATEHPAATTRRGAVYLFEDQATSGCKLVGSIDEGDFGWALAEAGDTDKNRWMDVLIGQPEQPDTWLSPSGPGTQFLRRVLR